MQELTKRINKWEDSQKAKLVALGQGSKPYPEILSYLDNEIKTSRSMANFRHQIHCFKSDGVYQLSRAIEEIYGVAEVNGDRGPSRTAPIETLDVKLADGTRIKVPYGKIELPELGEDASISIGYDNDSNTLIIKGSCQVRWSSMIDDIVDKTKWLLNTDSIYRNQAFELGSDFQPILMDLSNIDKEFMVVSKKTERDLVPLMVRITKPAECIAKGIPLKTGVLLEGPYGTGKTLLAFKIAQQATGKGGWSFIYLKDPSLLARTLKISKSLDNNGHGIIVFVEDIDQVTTGDRDEALQDILNTIDGGDTKQMNVIALFTTNHIDKINPTFLRGKRIGSIVSMGALDVETAETFLRDTFQGYELEEDGIQDVCQKIEDAQIVPAFMAEILESVKSNMIFADSNVIKAVYIEDSLRSYLRQVELSQMKKEEKSPGDKLADAIRGLLETPKEMEILTAVEQQLL